MHNELSLKADDLEKRKNKQTNKQRVYGLTYPLPPKYLLVFLLEIFRSFVFTKNVKIGTSSSRPIWD